MIRKFIEVNPLDVNLELSCCEVFVTDRTRLVRFRMAGTRRRRRRRTGFFSMLRLDVNLQKITRKTFMAVLARWPSPLVRRNIFHGVICKRVVVLVLPLVTHVAFKDLPDQDEVEEEDEVLKNLTDEILLCFVNKARPQGTTACKRLIG